MVWCNICAALPPMLAPACQRLWHSILNVHKSAQAGQVGLSTVKCGLVSHEETVIAGTSDSVSYHDIYVQTCCAVDIRPSWIHALLLMPQWGSVMLVLAADFLACVVCMWCSWSHTPMSSSTGTLMLISGVEWLKRQWSCIARFKEVLDLSVSSFYVHEEQAASLHATWLLIDSWCTYDCMSLHKHSQVMKTCC